MVKICYKIKGWGCFCVSKVVYLKFYTKHNDIHLFFGGFKQFAHHFTEICLTISIFYSKSKSNHCSLIGKGLKVRHQNWLLFDKFLSDFHDSCLILTRIVSQIWKCFWNQNPTIVAWTVTILVCIIEFRRQTEQGGWLIVSFFWGAIFSLPLYDGTSTSKSTLLTAMSDIT